MRILLVTGKGGVGKTTVAAATAVRAAEMGYRTLVTSTDPAHSLADAFQVKLGDEPTEVIDRLFAQQIDSMAPEIYDYLNFDQVPEFLKAADEGRSIAKEIVVQG